jgi:hypothetical protein
MSQFTNRRWPRLSYLIFAAGYASASLTLTNFSEIPDTVKSKSCQAAYNTPLSDCKPDDFTGSAVCSKKCRASVDDVEEAIQEGCEGVTVNDHDSLLYRALNGQLLDIICKSDGSSDDDDENEATTTTAVTSETVQKQIISTSIITKKTSAVAETATATTMTGQTTSLVLAGEEPSGVVASAVSSSAEATETSSGSGRGGDPFANNTSAGANLAVGYTTLVVSALMCMVAVM